MPVRAKRKYQQYDPTLDGANLKHIMGEVLQEEQATLLILVSRLHREHKDVIHYLSNQYQKTHPGVVYLEVNEKAIKVYRGNPGGSALLIDTVAKKTPKGTKVGPIDEVLKKYENEPHIVAVAGVLAGRGISFVSWTMPATLPTNTLPTQTIFIWSRPCRA